MKSRDGCFMKTAARKHSAVALGRAGGPVGRGVAVPWG